MNHLSSSEFVEYLEGALPPGRASHVQTCDACRAQADALGDGLARASLADLPEPSPLFWEHFSSRVHDAIAAEPPSARGWFGLWRMRPLPIVLATAAAALVVGVSLHRAPSTASPSAVPAIPAPSSLETAAIAPALGSASESDSSNDEAWSVLSAVASGIELEEAHAAGLNVRPGEIDRAVVEMTPAERAALGRLLEQELKRAGA